MDTPSSLLSDTSPSAPSSSVRYYSCGAARRLNEDLGDLRSRALDFEGAVLTDLVGRLWGQAPGVARAAAVRDELLCRLCIYLLMALLCRKLDDLDVSFYLPQVWPPLLSPSSGCG